MKEKAAYLKGLIDGLGIDENTKEGKVIKAMSELLSEMAEAVDSIDEDVTHAYDQINDLSEELEDLEADLYEDEDAEDEEEDSDDEITLLYVIRNANGEPVSDASAQLTWDQMWHERRHTSTIPNPARRGVHAGGLCEPPAAEIHRFRDLLILFR